MGLVTLFLENLLVEEYTTQEVTDLRLEACNTCEFRDDDKCSLCGCFIEIKAKMDKNKNPKNFFKVEKTHCKKGKWAFIDDAGVLHKSDLEIANFYNKNN